MLKILQARLQHYMNWELRDIQPGFWKGRGTWGQIANIRWIIEKAIEFQKNSDFCFIDYAKYSVWISTNCGKFLEMKISEHLSCLLRNLYEGQEATVRTRYGTWTGSKFGKKYVKAIYSHLAYLTYMQSNSCEMPHWMKHKLESKLPGEILIT